MRRREFVGLVGGAAAWPIPTQGQQRPTQVIGLLNLGSPEPFAPSLAAFRQGLSEIGFTEGRNVAVEYRFARNDANRLPVFATELVRRPVDVLFAPGFAAIRAAKAATTGTPIVFLTGGDPVQSGLVASLNRPGGNVTGVTSIAAELGAKRLGLLRELFPKAERLAVLVNPTNPEVAEPFIVDVRNAAATLGLNIEILNARTSEEIDSAFPILVQRLTEALVIDANTLFVNRRLQLVTLAAHHRIPAIYPGRAFTEIGGLMSYGTVGPDDYRQAGIYTGRILKGDKPASLPVMQPTKFELLINRQTAKTLGLEVPPTLLAIADEVID